MMDDIINEKRICPVCKKETDWLSMIWLSGECTCQACYEHKRRELDQIMRGMKGEETE